MYCVSYECGWIIGATLRIIIVGALRLFRAGQDFRFSGVYIIPFGVIGRRPRSWHHYNITAAAFWEQLPRHHPDIYTTTTMTSTRERYGFMNDSRFL